MQMFNWAFIKSRLHYILALFPKLTFFKLYAIAVALVSYLLKRDRSTAAPPLLIVNLTFRCNYSCIMCQKNAPGDNNPYKNPQSIDYETFAKLLTENARYLSLVRLHGGEPFFYTEIHELIDLLNERGIPYTVITNGYLLTPDIAEKLIKNCIQVSLSIDAVDSELYRHMRRGGTIEKVTENIRSLNEIKREHKSKTPILNISSAFFGFNIEELPKLVRYCHENGIESLSAGEGWGYNTPYIKDEDLIGHHADRARQSIAEARKLADELGVILRLKFPGLREHKSGDRPVGKKPELTGKSCLNLYVSAELHPDMSVIACCDAKAAFGSLRDASLRDIWNGPGYIDARRKLRSREVPEACRGCKSLYV
ncbi:radical SAM protein [bacterium]|nr:radical SAM protein [bacterium]